ncbi:MAG: two-component system chemotaxis sensor kinase CheA, partial [Psychrobacter okhotskensis]
MATTHNVDNKRYRSLIVSIALFLSLIGALLAFTFYTSSLLERNTVLIDQTNQVANSAQAVIKDLFDLDSSYGEDTSSPHIQRVLERLEQNTALITNSITAIGQGGEITDIEGNNYKLPKINENSQTKIGAANEQWQLLEPKIQSYLKDADNIMVDSSDELIQAVEQAKTSSLFINESLDQLTDEVFINAERQADTIRLIQVLGVAAIFAYFLIFVFFFVRRLRDTDAEALAARRETQEIMETVNTGLFLLDKDLNIGQQHSRALTNIIGADSLAGENFTNVLRGRISDKDLNTTRQFIEQLYNPRVKEKLVDSLNPLNKVMLHNAHGAEGADSRYLDFKFSRVYENKDIARILVNVNDVSDAVYLEQRLEKERSQNDMQIEMLTTILNVNPKIINEFISNTKAHIDKMNNILKNPGSSQFELEGKLNAIYREMHSLKGEASALKLHSFT